MRALRSGSPGRWTRRRGCGARRPAVRPSPCRWPGPARSRRRAPARWPTLYRAIGGLAVLDLVVTRRLRRTTLRFRAGSFGWPGVVFGRAPATPRCALAWSDSHGSAGAGVCGCPRRNRRCGYHHALARITRARRAWRDAGTRLRAGPRRSRRGYSPVFACRAPTRSEAGVGSLSIAMVSVATRSPVHWSAHLRFHSLGTPGCEASSAIGELNGRDGNVRRSSGSQRPRSSAPRTPELALHSDGQT